MPRDKYGFPAGSKLLHRQEQDRAFKLHRQKVHSMRPGLDNSPPRRYPHLVMRLKQTQQEEEHLATVDHENKLLLQKMMRIMERREAGLDNRNNYQSRSMNQPYKQRQAARIERENLEIAKRLEAIKPIYSTEKWEKDYKRHLYYLEMWSESSKDYTPRSTHRDEDEENKDQEKDKDKDKKEDDYESDFESDDDEQKKGDRKEDEKKGEKLPAIEQEKQQEQKERPKSGSSVEQLPDIKEKKKKPKHNYEMYWGRYYHPDFYEDEENSDNEGKQKDKDKDNEKGKNIQAEKDARQLFRVAKVMSPPHDIFIRTLVRRTPSQRQQIKQKFNELYDLDLKTELKQGLDKDWHLLIDALLPDDKEKDDKDDKDSRKGSGRGRGHGRGHGHGKGHGKGHGRRSGSRGSSRGGDRGGPEHAIHESLEKGDIPAVVAQLAEMTEFQLNSLQDKYKKEYAIGLDADIRERTKDPEQLFLLTLLKDKKDDGEKKDAHKDAMAIYESGEGRWSTPSGVFIKLLEERSNKHMRGVLLKYHQASDGTAAVKAIEQECSKEYAEAVQAFLSKGKNKGKGRRGSGSAGSREDNGSAMECAVLLYKNMHPMNETFVYTLVERAEIDMPAVRKAYRKKYKSELHTDLDDRSRHTTVNVLIELILKTPPSQSKGKGHDKDKDGKGQKRGHDKHQGQQHHDNRHKGQGQKKGHDNHDDHKQQQQQQHDQRDKGQGQKKGHDKHEGQKKGHDKKDDGGQKASPFGQTSKRGMAEARENKKKEEEGKGEKKKKKQDEASDEDVEKLHKAMDGLGTDEDTILEIIISKTNAQRQSLKKKYKEKYKKELADDLKSELSGDFEEVILGLLMPPIEYDAHCLHSAVKGLGTNEDVLIGIMCTANPKELSKVKEQYKKAYGEDLESALKGDTSGGFADMLVALCKGERDQGSSVSEKEAKEDAKTLYRDGKGLDIKDQTFVDLMNKKNKAQFQATDKEYKKLSGMTIKEAVKKAASGDTEDGYMGLMGAMDDPVTFYADSLQKACKGLGTNEAQLTRIIVSRSEVDLPAIKSAFQERHGRSLRAAIEDETSGDYKKALLKLVDKKERSDGGKEQRAGTGNAQESDERENDTNSGPARQTERAADDKSTGSQTTDPGNKLNGSGKSQASGCNGETESSDESDQKSKSRRKPNTPEPKPTHLDAEGVKGRNPSSERVKGEESEQQEKEKWRRFEEDGGGSETDRNTENYEPVASAESKRLKEIFKDPPHHNTKRYGTNTTQDQPSKNAGDNSDKNEKQNELGNGSKGANHSKEAGGNSTMRSVNPSSSTEPSTRKSRGLSGAKGVNSGVKKTKREEPHASKDKSKNDLTKSSNKKDNHKASNKPSPNPASKSLDSSKAPARQDKSATGHPSSKSKPAEPSTDKSTKTKHDEKNPSQSENGKSKKAAPKPRKDNSPEKSKNKETAKSKKTQEDVKGETQGAEEKQNTKVSEENTDFYAVKDAETLHSAMKGFGTDEQIIIQLVTSRSLQQRQDIRRVYLQKYEEDLMKNLESETSGDFRDVLLDLLRLPWERELHALRCSMAGLGTNERLLVHVLLTHERLTTNELAKKYKETYGKDLLKTVESETSGDFRRFVNTFLKIRLGKQKPDKRSGEETAKKLYNGGRTLLQTKPKVAVEDLATSEEKMAAICSHYKELCGHGIEEDVQKYLSGDLEMALSSYVSWTTDPEHYKIDVLYRSLVGEITFRIFSLVLAGSETELTKLQEQFESKFGSSMSSVAEKELAGDVRSLVLALLSRAQDGDGGKK